MGIENKVWGTANHVLYSDDIGISYLTVEKGHRCSIHYHSERWNSFQVTEGKIRIHVFDHQNLAYNFIDLGEGGYTKIEPNILHCFEVLETGKVVEIYWGTTVSFVDIVRFDVGEKFKDDIFELDYKTMTDIFKFAKENIE